jgi:AcrR family transcriptional regulator
MPKSNDLTDKRVLRTKRDIERALLRLMRERDFEKITIEQILESAEYSKAAFYSHYRNKADCFRSIIDQESQSLASCYYISRVKMLITNMGGGGGAVLCAA